MSEENEVSDNESDAVESEQEQTTDHIDMDEATQKRKKAVAYEKWRQNNKERRAAYLREWRAKNKDRVRAHNKKYAASHKETIATQQKRWRQKNADAHKIQRDEYGKRTVEANRSRAKKWAQENRARHNANSSVRRKRLRNAMPSWVNQQDVKDIYLKCPKGYHVDHIVPLKGITADGYKISGLHVPWNLRIIPAKENFRRRNKMTADEAQYINGAQYV